MEWYFSGKEADLSGWDTAINDYGNERSKCRDFYPWKVFTMKINSRKLKFIKEKSYEC